MESAGEGNLGFLSGYHHFVSLDPGLGNSIDDNNHSRIAPHRINLRYGVRHGCEFDGVNWMPIIRGPSDLTIQ